MNATDRYQLDAIAKALTAYANASEADPTLKARLDRIGVPAGLDIELFAKDARRCAVSS